MGHKELDISNNGYFQSTKESSNNVSRFAQNVTIFVNILYILCYLYNNDIQYLCNYAAFILIRCFRSYTAQNSLYVLNWSILVLRNGYKRTPDVMKNEIKTLIESQSILLTKIYAGDLKKKCLKAYSKVE